MHPVAAIAGVTQALPNKGTRWRFGYATKNRKRARGGTRPATHTCALRKNDASRHAGLPLWQGILPARLLGDHQQDTVRDARAHAAARYGNLAPSLCARARRQVRGIAQNTHRAWAKRVQPWPAQRHVPKPAGLQGFEASSAVVK